jgi:adenosylcobinamide-GDP ribazoletransferase
MDERGLATSLSWFSLIGLFIGLILAAVDWLAARVLPEPTGSAIVIAALALVTGGLHLDGLADSCDGLFGGATPERRLEIMRDSRTGTFGVLGVVLVLLLKWSALVALVGHPRFAALVIVPALSRMALVAAIALYPYARPTGLGKHFHAQAGVGSFALAAVAPVATIVILLGPVGLGLIIPALATVLLGGWYIRSKIGGLTGDSYGALTEITEAVLLLVLASRAKIGA